MHKDQFHSLKGEFQYLYKDSSTNADSWLNFSSKMASFVEQVLQKSLETRDIKDIQLGLDSCRIGLSALQRVGRVTALLPQLTMANGLFLYQSGDYYNAGRFFFISHSSFVRLNHQMSTRALEYTIDAYDKAIKEYYLLVRKLIQDNYIDISYYYIIRTLNCMIRLKETLIVGNITKNPLKDQLVQTCGTFSKFLVDRQTYFSEDKDITTIIYLLENLKMIEFQNKQFILDQISKIEKDLVKLVKSEMRMLLVIYDDGRPVFGYDFENEFQDVSKFSFYSGIFFAVFSIFDSELKSGMIKQVETEEGESIILDTKRRVYFCLICRGEASNFRSQLEAFANEFINRFEVDDWNGIDFTDDVLKSNLISLIFN